MITKRNANKLKKQLESLGFGRIINWIDDYRKSTVNDFSVFWSFKKEREYVSYNIKMIKEDNTFKVKAYELTVLATDIPHKTINGINTLELEAGIQKADELYNQYLDGRFDPRHNYLIEESDNVLKRLFHSGEQGKEIAQRLMFRYWLEKQYREFIPDDSLFKQKYEMTLTVEVGNGKTIKAHEAYKYLKEMQKEHVIADEALALAKNEIQAGNHFIAYNTVSYFLDKPDMYFFKSKDEADEFSDNNISEYDNFRVIHVESIDELLKQIPYGEQARIQLITSNNKIMNEQNFADLEKKLLNLGFGNQFNEEMKKNIIAQKPEFNLAGQVEYGGRTMLVDLSFKAGKENEMYFFNNYQATLDDDPEKSQRFYLDKGNGVTTKEAFNLLEGRAVNKDLKNKEGVPYNAWVQLNFKETEENGNYKINRYHENYNFDLGKAVNEMIIKPMSEKEETDLYKSLLKGNVQSVTFLKDGEEVKGFIEANPKDRTLNVYDGHMKPLNKEQKEELMDILASKPQAQKQAAKPGDDGGDDIELKKKRTRKQGNGMKM